MPIFTGTRLINTAEINCLIGMYVQNHAANYDISIITPDWVGDWYKSTDTTMIEGHLPPDFMLRERKGVW